MENGDKRLIAAALGPDTPKDILRELETGRVEQERRERRFVLKLVILSAVFFSCWFLLTFVGITWSWWSTQTYRLPTSEGLDVAVVSPGWVSPGTTFDILVHVRREPNGPNTAVIQFASTSDHLSAKNAQWHHRFDFSEGDTEDWTLSLAIRPPRVSYLFAIRRYETVSVRVASQGTTSTPFQEVQLGVFPLAPAAKGLLALAAAIFALVGERVTQMIRGFLNW